MSPDGNPTGTTWVVRANVCPSERNETDDDDGACCERMPDGSTVEFDADVRIDTPGEADYYRNGGILQYVLRGMLRS